VIFITKKIAFAASCTISLFQCWRNWRLQKPGLACCNDVCTCCTWPCTDHHNSVQCWL